MNLGNVAVKESSIVLKNAVDGQDVKAEIKVRDDNYLKCAAKFLKVDVNRLVAAISVRRLRIKGQETTYVSMNSMQAAETRDALVDNHILVLAWFLSRYNNNLTN